MTRHFQRITAFFLTVIFFASSTTAHTDFSSAETFFAQKDTADTLPLRMAPKLRAELREQMGLPAEKHSQTNLIPIRLIQGRNGRHELRATESLDELRGLIDENQLDGAEELLRQIAARPAAPEEQALVLRAYETLAFRFLIKQDYERAEHVLTSAAQYHDQTNQELISQDIRLSLIEDYRKLAFALLNHFDSSKFRNVIRTLEAAARLIKEVPGINFLPVKSVLIGYSRLVKAFVRQGKYDPSDVANLESALAQYEQMWKQYRHANREIFEQAIYLISAHTAFSAFLARAGQFEKSYAVLQKANGLSQEIPYDHERIIVDSANWILLTASALASAALEKSNMDYARVAVQLGDDILKRYASRLARDFVGKFSNVKRSVENPLSSRAKDPHAALAKVASTPRPVNRPKVLPPISFQELRAKIRASTSIEELRHFETQVEKQFWPPDSVRLKNAVDQRIYELTRAVVHHHHATVRVDAAGHTRPPRHKNDHQSSKSGRLTTAELIEMARRGDDLAKQKLRKRAERGNDPDALKWIERRGRPELRRVGGWTPVNVTPEQEKDGWDYLHALYPNGYLENAVYWHQENTRILIENAIGEIERMAASGADEIHAVDLGTGAGTSAVEFLKAIRRPDIKARLKRANPNVKIKLLLTDVLPEWFSVAWNILHDWQDPDVEIDFHLLRDSDNGVQFLSDVLGKESTHVIMAGSMLHLLKEKIIGKVMTSVADTLKPGGAFIWNTGDIDAPRDSNVALLHDPYRRTHMKIREDKDYQAALEQMDEITRVDTEKKADQIFLPPLPLHAFTDAMTNAGLTQANLFFEPINMSLDESRDFMKVPRLQLIAGAIVDEAKRDAMVFRHLPRAFDDMRTEGQLNDTGYKSLWTFGVYQKPEKTSPALSELRKIQPDNLARSDAATEADDAFRREQDLDWIIGESRKMMENPKARAEFRKLVMKGKKADFADLNAIVSGHAVTFELLGLLAAEAERGTYVVAIAATRAELRLIDLANRRIRNGRQIEAAGGMEAAYQLLRRQKKGALYLAKSKREAEFARRYFADSVVLTPEVMAEMSRNGHSGFMAVIEKARELYNRDLELSGSA